MMLAMLGLFILRTLAQWIVTYLGHLTGVHIEADMRAAIFAHMQKLGFSFYDKNRTGLLMSRVTTDLFDITELAHHGPEDLFISLVTLTGSFIILWRIQKTLALVLMIAVPLIVIFVATRRRTAGVLATLVSGLAEPLGAVLAWLFLRRLFTPGFLNGTVVLAAGVMVWVALAQLLPGALHPAQRTAGILGAAVGCLLMLLGIAALP